MGGPVSIKFTPGAQPDSFKDDIQFAELPEVPRGQECPTLGCPSVVLSPAFAVQSLQVAELPYSFPSEPVPVRKSWLSTCPWVRSGW